MFFIRTAGPKDVEPVRKLLAETWHATYDPIHGPLKVGSLVTSLHSSEAILKRINLKDGEFLVADDGKRIGGMGFAAMSPTMTKTAVLHQLYVHPTCQNEGIGRDLFAELETCFPDAEILRLEVDVANERAISFYTRLGFTEVDRTKNCGQDNSGIEAIIMEKPLAH